MKRSLAREVRLFAVVFSVPAALVLAFPREALSFHAAPPREVAAAAAFVTLDEKAMSKALRSARSAWQYEADGARSGGARFPLDRLPDAPVRPFASASDLSVLAAPEAVGYPFGPLKPSRRAAPPAVLAREPPRPMPLAFSRAELLALGNR